MVDSVQSNAPGPGITMPTVEGRYDSLSPYREPYLQRAYDCAELTLPALLPRNGHTSSTVLPTPWNSLGARAVNNLASKLLLALFPPNTPVFKIVLSAKAIQQLEQENPDQNQAKSLRTEYDKAFSVIEQMVMSEIEVSGDRTALFESLKHVIVTGNVLLHNSKQGLRVFPINQFVIRRDPAGNILEVILKEEIDPIAVPGHVRKVLEANKMNGGTQNAYSAKKSVSLFTYVARTQTEWVTYQEVNKEIIESTRGSFPLDRSPWIGLRFNRINGEDYGRGYVEEYMGDMLSLDKLSAAIIQGAAAAARLLFLIKPGSSTNGRDLAKVPNGGFGVGNADDVKCLEVNKQGDFSTAKSLRDDLVQQLSYAFLLNTAIQRPAERVTAEEIRYMAQELEQTLGGFYSIMSVELQTPYINSKMDSLERQGKLPRLPKDTARPMIVTGLEALGRGNDRDKLVRFLTTLATALGQPVVAQYVNVSEAIERLAISDGIVTKNLIRTDEQIQSQQEAQAQTDQQRQMMMEGMKSLGPATIHAFGAAAKQRIANEGQQGGQPTSPPPAQ